MIRWKPADDGFVESHCGRWRITPIYGGGTRPESYSLFEVGADGRWTRRGWYEPTQREAKEHADRLTKAVPVANVTPRVPALRRRMEVQMASRRKKAPAADRPARKLAGRKPTGKPKRGKQEMRFLVEVPEATSIRERASLERRSVSELCAFAVLQYVQRPALPAAH